MGDSLNLTYLFENAVLITVYSSVLFFLLGYKIVVVRYVTYLFFFRQGIYNTIEGTWSSKSYVASAAYC